MDMYILVSLIVSIVTMSIFSFLILKKYDIMYIDVAKYLVSFIRLKLCELNFTSNNFETTLDLLVQSILYVIASRNPQQTLPLSYDKHITKAMGFILTHLHGTGIKLSDIQVNIIKNIMKSAFLLLENISVSENITEKNYLKIYRKATIYMKIENPRVVGLRKHI